MKQIIFYIALSSPLYIFASESPAHQGLVIQNYLQQEIKIHYETQQIPNTLLSTRIQPYNSAILLPQTKKHFMLEIPYLKYHSSIISTTRTDQPIIISSNANSKIHITQDKDVLNSADNKTVDSDSSDDCCFQQ